MSLRSWLRTTLQPDERVIAWATVGSQPRLRDVLGFVLGMALPGPGWIAAWLLADTEDARFAVLTNQRLLALPTASIDEPAGRRKIRQFPFDALEVSCPDGETFHVKADPGRDTWTFVVSDQSSRPAERLRAALTRLCELEADEPPDPSPAEA